ncbi:MAG: Na/Pi cotransporter family protein [Fibromonadales bacterium]|nr:Na/Pi cotransporter family protein [Fibromonadales bacterium]
MEKPSSYLEIAFALIGGIGFFLLGMKFLSEGLQKIAGNKIRSLIAVATNNRVFGVGVGFLVTAIIQSSSVTTVLVVSFVDSGLMTLAQAVGVIMGANIGTTLTAWILTIKIEQYGLVLAGLGAIFYVFSSKEMVKYVGISVLGLGCIFLGLMIMKFAASPIKDFPEFAAAFQTFKIEKDAGFLASYLGILKCAFAGCLLTVVIQSSTVTIGITMVLASQGLINFESAAALVLGENLGTTLTAIIASLTGNNNARRAASFHALFNVIGVFYMTLIFFPALDFIKWELEFLFGITNVEHYDGKSLINVGLGIAALHTTFNIFNTLVFLGPCRQVARFLESAFLKKILVKARFFRKEKPKIPEVEMLLTMLNNSKESSYIRFVDAESRIQKVLNYMGSQLKTGLQNLKACIESTEKESPEIEQIFEMEKMCDKTTEKIQGILACFVGSEETTTQAVQQRIFKYERIFDSLESVSDYMTQVVKLRLRVLDNKTDLLDFQKEDLLKLTDLIAEAMASPNSEMHEKKFSEVKDFIRSMRTTLWNAAGETATNLIVNDSYSNMLTSYRKIRDHLRSYGNVIFGIDKD